MTTLRTARRSHSLVIFALIFTVMSLSGLSLPGVSIADDAKQPSEKPPQKITPGKVIVPYDRMRRIWGELISLDLENRTGTFRRESDDEVMSFVVMPYAELLHHATNGDLQDFRVGERAIFRLHENEQGDWVWLTYIQDEMNMMNGHKEYYFVDSIDADKGELTCTQAKGDKSFIRKTGIVIKTDQDTRYWKNGEPASFSDIQIGDGLRTKTRGTGAGKDRIAWEVFLDDESLLKFREEQIKVHQARIAEQGAPGYIDEVSSDQLQITLFHEGDSIFKPLKVGDAVELAPAGVDRKPIADRISGKVTQKEIKGRICRMTIATMDSTENFQPTKLVRLWPAQ